MEQIATLIIALPLLFALAIFLVIALSTRSNDDQPESNPDFTPDPMVYTQAGKLHPGRELDKR